jgi:hypothetical protein
VKTLERKVLISNFVKLADPSKSTSKDSGNKSKVSSGRAAPLLMPLFLRGAAEGASRLGHRAMLESHGRQLADMGIDPFDLPGKRQTTWIDPTMMYGMGLGIGAHALNSAGVFGNQYAESNVPLYIGTALGGTYGAYQTYKKQRDLARDIVLGNKTEDTEYVKTRDYIKDTLERQKKK